MRPVCLGCKQEMKRTRLGIFVRTGRGRFLSGDEFVCPGCGARIAADFAKSEFSSLHDNVKFEACLMTKETE